MGSCDARCRSGMRSFLRRDPGAILCCRSGFNPLDAYNATLYIEVFPDVPDSLDLREKLIEPFHKSIRGFGVVTKIFRRQSGSIGSTRNLLPRKPRVQTTLEEITGW